MNAKKAVLGVVVALVLGGCAAQSDDSLDQDQGALSGAASAKFIDHNSEHRAGEFIVVFNDTQLSGPSRTSIASKYNARVFKSFNIIPGFAAQMTDADARRLAADPDVKFVERNGIKHTSEVQSSATWGIDRTDQVNLPLDQKYNYTLTGQGVNAVVIDTGVDARHPDFEGRVAPGFSALDTGSATDSSDVHGHGTHVAGTMASKTWGLAKKATIVPVKVCNSQGQCTDADIIQAVEWVTANVAKPAVVNMSLGGEVTGAPTATEEAIRASINSGIAYVVAAGNSSKDACGFSPARMPEVTTVGATGKTDSRAFFSNFGRCLDIFAPGSGIISAKRNSTGSTSMDGTSMASPHVAGVAALLLQNSPEATPAQIGAQLVSNASTDKVKTPGAGSPNKLLHLGETVLP